MDKDEQLIVGVAIYLPKIKFLTKTYWSHDLRKGLTFGKVYTLYLSGHVEKDSKIYTTYKIFDDNDKKYLFVKPIGGKDFKIYLMPKKLFKSVQ